jgi:hypothetical protein
MARLHLLDQVGIDQSIPIVISEGLSKCQFFRELVTKGSLPQRNWLVQPKDVYFQTDELTYAQSRFSINGHLEYLMGLMDVEPDRPLRFRRVFLTRDKKRGRYLSNMESVREVLDEYGFEAVDTDGMSLDEQIQLFQEVGYLIGLHGAGLTNIMYRKGEPLHLLEIFSPHSAPLYFYLLSQQLGYKYDYMVGSSTGSVSHHTPYTIDPDILRSKISKMISDSEPVNARGD